jgi:hypothetical protein
LGQAYNISEVLKNLLLLLPGTMSMAQTISPR